ncbi:MAG: HI0074 family nucleotidyltransferase substrate-binding subunit [Pseudobdellovibrionaceae bacterium]
MQRIVVAISKVEFVKALKSLEVALGLMHKIDLQEAAVQKALRDACIQRFEYCIELAWKVSMKVLGSTTLAAKPAVREMARNNLIDNPDLWLEFIEARNETSHAYDEDVAAKVFANAVKFLSEAEKLLVNLERSK